MSNIEDVRNSGLGASGRLSKPTSKGRFSSRKTKLSIAVACVAVLLGAVVVHAAFSGNASSVFSGVTLASVAFTANAPTGGSGGGSCGSVTTSGGSVTCPAVSYVGAAAGATYSVSYTIAGGSNGEVVNPTSAGTSGASVSCPSLTLNGSGSGTGECTITPTANSGTVELQVSL